MIPIPGSLWGMLKDLANNGVFILPNAGTPTNGTSGTGVNLMGPGSLLIDITNNVLYMNIGTKASPFWQATSLAESNATVIRTRVTTAQINAGFTLLPAIPGYHYRILDMDMIAIGGAAAGATAVVINATQSSAGVSLLSVAIAALTQSALVRAGAANATILADGASFIDLDTNTAVTAAKTGGSLTTATAIDIFLTYALVKG